MYPRTVPQERTMMRVGRKSANHVHLATTVWDGQSPTLTTPAPVVITVRSIQPSLTSSHVSLGHLTT